MPTNIDRQVGNPLNEEGKMHSIIICDKTGRELTGNVSEDVYHDRAVEISMAQKYAMVCFCENHTPTLVKVFVDGAHFESYDTSFDARDAIKEMESTYAL